jgi:hypothetical protein
MHLLLAKWANFAANNLSDLMKTPLLTRGRVVYDAAELQIVCQQ